MEHDEGLNVKEECCSDGESRDCDERGMSHCRREGGRGRGGGSCGGGREARDAMPVASADGARIAGSV